MTIEQNTNYAYKLKYMDNPTFDKVRDLAIKFMRELPKPLQDELYEALNRGIDILDSEPQMVTYLYAFGPMHQAKLNYAFKHLPEEFFEQPEINIIDYGCGQALGTMCYADYLRENGYAQKVKTITLIEPSEMCLKRAALHTSVFFADAEIKTVNKSFDELVEDDICCDEDTPTLHILSNVMDILSFNLDKFAKLVKGCLKGYNQFVCVGPYFNSVAKDNRMTDFASQISGKISYETFDKRELNPEKDWTCSVLLCANGTNSIKTNIIELDCDKVFEYAVMFSENMEKDLNSDYCKELFYKLQICARFGDKRCQNQLGLWYLYGIGTEQNYINALEWLNISAEQGYISAYTNLGNLYFKGVGVEKDLKKAAEYYKMSAELGCKGGQTGLGVCYINGAGVEKDSSAAFYWFGKASKQNYPAGIFRLGLCYLNGWGTDTNLAKAIELFTKAGKQKHVKSIKKLIALFEEKKGIEYFSDDQYDVFVKAAQMNIKGVLPIFTLDWFSTPSKMQLIDNTYSYEDIYDLLLKSIKEHGKRDEEQVFVYELSEIHNAYFVFQVLNHLSILTNKSLGFYARFRHNHELINEHYELPPWNSLFPYVHDSNVHIKDIVINHDDSIPSQYITAPICTESFWEIFLLDNLEDFLPKWDHGNYSTRHLILSHKSTVGLPNEIIKHIQEKSIELEPSIVVVYKNLIRIQCVYYNAWEGLVQWCDYYLFQEIPNGKMKVAKLKDLSGQTNMLYKYKSPIRF